MQPPKSQNTKKLSRRLGVIVISRLLKRHLKIKRRAPDYSRALRRFRGVVHISRVCKQRCITASFFESAYLISKFAEFYALSCWQKCIYYNEHQSLRSKSCSNNAYLLGCLRFVLQKCVSLIHFEGAYVPYYYTWYITGLHQNVMWPKCISL